MLWEFQKNAQKSGQKINSEILKNIKIKNIYPIKPSKLLLTSLTYNFLPPLSITNININQMHGKWPSIESIYREYKDFEIRKFTMPVKECKNLLQKLESCDISISKIMPHYKYSAEEVLLTQNYL